MDGNKHTFDFANEIDRGYEFGPFTVYYDEEAKDGGSNGSWVLTINVDSVNMVISINPYVAEYIANSFKNAKVKYH